MVWKKGRGKLGLFSPLLGTWVAKSTGATGPVTCTRDFQRVLGGKYVQLQATWTFADSSYEEIALFGVGDDKTVCFWSFTSDGRRATGTRADATDLHPQAIGFEAKMPAGLARMVYWPDEQGDGFHWVVESHTKKGWNRFVAHHYGPLSQ